MDNKFDLTELLEYIDPSTLNYQEWVNVGMALKEEGYTAADWDNWSQRDHNRYHSGECFKKWTTFEGNGTPVTGATITQLAKDNGWKARTYEEDYALGWDDEGIADSRNHIVVDKNWLERKEIQEPKNWNPAQELITYLETLFESTENVGYVTETWEKDGKHLPTKGHCNRTAGQLIQELDQYHGDIGAVLGDYNPEAGAWIRFNPLDGQGVKNENVTDFRYALVESDTMDVGQQNAILRELELPIACLVFSGKKSIHAIVRIDAADYKEYRKRVDYLYDVCKKNGLNIDSQNRNPSRLSRMPGVERNGAKQFLIDTNIGKADWEEWHEWIEGINDDLPEPETLEDYWNNMPDLAPELIKGVLRQGHKMLMAGPSKAGKSFALIELSIAIAEGKQWLGWDCAQGKVLYVNLELDRASCYHRFKDVYKALGWRPDNLNHIDIWNLRGKSVPMDKLAPKLIRRAAKKNYIAVIIDPIYKVLTGDENSADQMAHFTNQFDKVCTELGSSVIYCHHHSKGAQGGKKSMDRASGSGVFARDPDALIDLVELDLTDDLLKQVENRLLASIYEHAFKRFCPQYLADEVSQDDLCSAKAMEKHAGYALQTQEQKQIVARNIENGKALVKVRSGWRIEGTLREFPKFEARNVWFRYPIHAIDEAGVLKDVKIDGEEPPWNKKLGKKKTATEKLQDRKKALEEAYSALNMDAEVTVTDIAEYLGVTEKTVRNRINEHKGYVYVDGKILKKDEIK